MNTLERKFHNTVKKGLLERKVQTSDYYQYKLNTNFGVLNISIYEDWVATRFEDVKKATLSPYSFTVNPYSGKWNHHFNFNKRTAKKYNCNVDDPINSANLVLSKIDDLLSV